MTDDDLLSPEILEEAYFALKAEEVRTMCRSHMGEAFSRLVGLAATARDPELRRKASALLRSGSGRLAWISSGGALSSQAISRSELWRFTR